MLKLNAAGWIALALIIIGALNWGLVGIFNGFDFVGAIFGELSAISRLIYIIVGLAAIYTLAEVTTTFRVKWLKTHRRQPA